MAEKKKEVKHAVLGRKDLDPKKKYKLNLGQRSALKAHGESIETVPVEMTGAQLMKYKQWKNLSL